MEKHFRYNEPKLRQHFHYSDTAKTAFHVHTSAWVYGSIHFTVFPLKLPTQTFPGSMGFGPQDKSGNW